MIPYVGTLRITHVSVPCANNNFKDDTTGKLSKDRVPCENCQTDPCICQRFRCERCGCDPCTCDQGKGIDNEVRPQYTNKNSPTVLYRLLRQALSIYHLTVIANLVLIRKKKIIPKAHAQIVRNSHAHYVTESVSKKTD